MSELTHKMINYARILRKRIAELEVIKESAPDGTLRLRKVSNNTHYSHRVSEKGKRRELYLSSDKQDIIMSLAEKKYACDVIPILKKNLAAAEVFLSMHSGKDENDVANLINDEYLDLCRDLVVSNEKYADNWSRQKWSETPGYSSKPFIPTLRGDLVRSKSEAFIANALFQHDIYYSYEKPLYLDGLSYPVFPDFTILDAGSRSELYWEHFGLMDVQEYNASVFKKISNYVRNGIIPGDKLICTFETRDQPLSSADVEAYIEYLLVNRPRDPFVV